MKKKRIFLVILAVLIIGLGVIGITNKTFFKTYYETTNSKKEVVKIPLPLFSYFEGEKGEYTATFKTLRGIKSVGNMFNNYVEKLTSCYDESYFYDDKLGITISDYYIEDGLIFNKINLTYRKDNYCEDQYVLDDNWMTEIKDKSTINEVIITKCNTKDDTILCTPKSIDNYDIEEAYNYMNKDSIIRIENKDNITNVDGDDTYIIKVHYTLNKSNYVLSIFSHNTNYLAFKVVDMNDHPKNAIYDMKQNTNELLKQVWEKVNK